MTLPENIKFYSSSLFLLKNRLVDVEADHVLRNVLCLTKIPNAQNLTCTSKKYLMYYQEMKFNCGCIHMYNDHSNLRMVRIVLYIYPYVWYSLDKVAKLIKFTQCILPFKEKMTVCNNDVSW